MSKQSEAKKRQGYTIERKICSTCQHYTSDRDWPAWMKDGKHDRYRKEENKVETNIRCGIGGFAIKKTATCDYHKST